MKSEKLSEIAETFLNGNIDDARNEVKKMSKHDLVRFITCLSSYTNLGQALIDVGKLTERM